MLTYADVWLVWVVCRSDSPVRRGGATLSDDEIDELQLMLRKLTAERAHVGMYTHTHTHTHTDRETERERERLKLRERARERALTGVVGALGD